MALSLQVKKFINSEHVGDYVEITLPGFADKAGQQIPEPVRMHYLEAGTGEPLLLVHTVGQSLYTWRNVFNELSAHYRVIAVDLLGHGFSGRPVQFDYTIAEQADALRMFLDAKGIESAHIAGFSLGAMYALDFIIRYPERVGKAILLSPGGITPEMPLGVRMMGTSLLGAIACRLYTRKVVNGFLSDCLFDLTTLNDEVLDGYYQTIADGLSRRAIQYSIANFNETDVMASMRTVQAPALILWGVEDKWHPPAGSELFHAAISSAEFSVIRNAGHLMHEEKPNRFIEAVLEYIPAPVDEA
ncbi:alpha/beta hydrolase [Christensenellaceae bacterium OttesenSCG-928-L17]|nr:alpha/beta hydrolase [Christensenellaceae bacterium OttesenSCG-928-L17]